MTYESDEWAVSQATGDRNIFKRDLEALGATEDEIEELLETTDMDGVVDESALAYARLASLRRVVDL